MTKKAIGPRPMLHPLPAVLVGTWNEDGTPNAMTAAWSATCCMDPPCVGVAIRKARLTYRNIERAGAFTICVPRASMAARVDYLGIVSGKDVPDKLARAAIHASKGSQVDAPLLDECPVVMECRLRGSTALGSHTWFVGEVLETHVDEGALDRDGRVDPMALDPLVYCTGDRAYHRIGGKVADAYEAGKSISKKG